MKIPFLLLAVCAASAMADDDIIPSNWDDDRFQEMSGKSPFVLATPVVQQTKVDAPVTGPFDNMYIAGIGTDYVLVKKQGDDQPMRFWGNEPDAEGISVKEIQWADKVKASKVVLRKGNYEKEISFNENLFHTASAPAGPRGAGGGMNPRAAAALGGLTIRPGSTPAAAGTGTNTAPRPVTSNVPRPAIQSNIPRPNGTLTTPPASGNYNRTNTTEGRSGRESFQGRGTQNTGGSTPAAGNDSGNRRRERGAVRGISQ